MSDMSENQVKKALQRMGAIFAEQALPALRERLGPGWDAFYDELRSILDTLDTFPVELVVFNLRLLLDRHDVVRDALQTYVSMAFPEIEGLVSMLVSPVEFGMMGEKRVDTRVEMEEAAGEGAPANYVNFEYVDLVDQHTLELYEGFYSDYEYRLEVSITQVPDVRFEGDQVQPDMEWPSEDEEPITLYVALFSKDEDVQIVGKPLDTLVWAPGRSLKKAEFVLKAARTDREESGQIEVYFFHRANLLYTARHKIQIMADDHEWEETERPITWVYRDDADRKRSRLFKKFAAANKLRERALCLAIERGQGEDEFTITAFMGRAELPARVKMTRQELSGHLVTIRGLLDELRKTREYIEEGYDRKGEYVGVYVGTRAAETFEKFIREAAQVGQRFWEDLRRTESFRLLSDAIEAHYERGELAKGDIIQVWIDQGATDFVYPWPWLYTLPIDRSHPWRKEGFWGYRYVIEQLPQFPETVGKEFETNEIPAEDALRVKIGVFNFAQIDNQKRFFARCSETSKDALEHQVWHRRSQWEQFLPACDSQVLYFFTHGHTAKPKTLEGQQFARFYDTLFEGWEEWLKKPFGAQESEWMAQYRQQGLDFLEVLEGPERLRDETFILLQSGYLTLPKLRNMNLWNSAPMVFLNMCESAQVSPTLSEGLIDVFLKHGARGVVGTEMPMIPHFADLFSRRFFERFFFGRGTKREVEEVGKILLDLRCEFLEKGNPLGFAYVLFGDATTRLSRSLPLEGAA